MESRRLSDVCLHRRAHGYVNVCYGTATAYPSGEVRLAAGWTGYTVYTYTGCRRRRRACKCARGYKGAFPIVRAMHGCKCEFQAGRDGGDRYRYRSQCTAWWMKRAWVKPRCGLQSKVQLSEMATNYVWHLVLGAGSTSRHVIV